MSACRITATEIGPGCSEVRVEGELDLAVVDQLQEALGRCAGPQTLVDLADCEFIDSTGIAVLVRAHRERRNDGGGRLAIHSPSDHVRRVFTITGLNGIGLVFDDRDEALGDPALQN
jgi:anti-anti-sigma factor